MINMKKIPAEVGMMSLVGILDKEFPVSFGNYFSFSIGIRSINMWAENLQHARTHFLKDGLIEVDVWSNDRQEWAVVTDSRLPKGYTTKVPCFTGCYSPNIDMLKNMGEIYGWDQHDEFRKYTDPENWYRERGWEYYNGIIRKKVDVKPRKLKAGWTVENGRDT